MAAPLKIRLVKKNGDLIHLDCTDYTINVQRGVTVLPVPFTGERVGVDMNQVQSDIRLECILRDDDCDGIAHTVEPSQHVISSVQHSSHSIVQSGQ